MDVDRTMDAAELARWTRFAAKGGIGKCTATSDCVAEAAADLMFLKNDEIVVLMQLQEENSFLGYCEGIVGRFNANHVHFHSKLKKPVMTKRSSVSANSNSGKSTPTPSVHQNSSPSPKAAAGYQQSPPTSPHSHLRYQPPSPPWSRSSSAERIPRSETFSSTTVSFSNSASLSTPLSSSSLSSAVPDTPATVYSPEPPRGRPLDPSLSAASMDTNVSGRSSTYMGSVSSSTSGLEGEGSENPDGNRGRNRRSETTTVEMWPTSSPSAALARKPVNGSRLALAIHPPDSSEESGEEAEGLQHSQSESEGEYDPDDGGWAHVPETLPLQVVKLNSAASAVPPSPYQASRSDALAQSQASQPSFSRVDSDATDSDSDYNTSDSEDPNDETTRFTENRSNSPASTAQHHHPTPSLTVSVRSEAGRQSPPSIDAESTHDGNTNSSLMHEESTRLSIAAPSFQGSEDGEVGIGLSLLQGMLGGDDASDEEEEEEEEEDGHPTPSLKDAVSEHVTSGPSTQRNSVVSTVRSVPHGDEWDGASDIYEDYYRFSRYSTKSRSSTSTFSSASGPRRKLSGPSTQVIPPVPTDLPHETESTRSRKRLSVDSDASVYTQASKVSSIDTTGQTLLHRPAPLQLNDKPSPLLHTRWGSPLSSASPPTSAAAQSTFFDGGVPASTSSGSTGFGGAASALRQRLEVDRSSPTGAFNDVDPQEGDGLGRRIVIEDDEEPPASAITEEPRSESPENVFEEEETDSDGAGRKAGLDSLAPLVINDPPDNDTPDSTAPTSASPSTSPQSLITSTALTTPVSPLSPPDLPPPPPPQSTSQSHHQPRPSLSELRGYMGSNSSSHDNSWDAPAQRTSLFLPHPNAPKPPPASVPDEGPMYIRSPPPPSQQRSESVVSVIKMSIGRSAVTRVMPTIYGQTDTDLGSATGPVRMVFSMDPLPPLSVPLPSQIPFRDGTAPKSSARRAASESARGASQSGSPASSSRSTVTPGRSPTVGNPGSSSPARSSPLAEKPVEAPKSTGVIPRPNFFPKAGTSRPRSRSFSGFNTPAPEPSLSLDRSQVTDSNSVQKPRPVPNAIAPSPAPSTSSSSPSPPPALGKHASRSSLRSAHAPSPLSLPQNNSLGGTGGMRSPTSPLAPSPLSTGGPSNPASRPHQLRQMTSRSTLNEGSSMNRLPLTRSATSTDSPTVSPVDTRNESLLSNSRPSLDTESTRVLSPTPSGRDSIRHKLSLPNLRRNQSRQSSGDNDMVQVKDMDFELVRPNLAQLNQTSGRSSEDSLLGTPRDASSIDGRASNSGGDAYLRTESPTVSVSSAGHQAPRSSSTESSIDAHRQRELKWVSLMSIVPPAQATKSKKVKKLLMDGSVPSSVRFLVWSHLTDGKAKMIHGVYTQLGKRPRVGILSEVERDVQRCSAAHPQMQSNQTSVLSLLQAYLSMVPDIRYSVGLTLISGHLLALSPEEDAFWIFVSIMDSYLRPYFSSNTTQLEVDAALFSRTLESNDPQVAKKVLLDMSLNPVDLCRPWFSTLFIDALPLDYLNRVWDLFLYEGVPFLFRVALALFSCCRRRVLEAINQDSLFDVLRHPPPTWLPPSPDALIALAYSFKVKDDDIRKQRIKMEAQVKRQTQVPRANAVTTKSLSFPRN